MIVQEILTAQCDLDQILVELCEMILNGMSADDGSSLVAACIIDPDGNKMYSTGQQKEGKWMHAEHMAITLYEKRFGPVPSESICVTTLSPCTKRMDDRYGESCEKILQEKGITNVYSGYRDPTQDGFRYPVTSNVKLRKFCKKFADIFLK